MIKYAECLSAEPEFKKNINVNVIAPGLLPTKITRNILKRGKKFLGKEKNLLHTAVKLKSLKNFNKIYSLIKYLELHKDITGKVFSSVYDNFDAIKKNHSNLDSFSLRRLEK